MANRDLLKEAIADAKAVKETAIANAKAALEEAFTPMLREKLAAKLAEMDDMEDVNENDSMTDEEINEDSFTSSEKETGDYGKVRNVDDYNDDKPNSKIAKAGTDDGGEKEIDEVDLEELLRELDELDEDGFGPGSTDGTEGFSTEIEGDDDTPIKALDEVEGEEDFEDKDADGVEDSEDEEIDIENMDENDLKSFIESVIADMVSAGELEAGEGMEGEEGETGEEGAEGEEGEEEMSVDMMAEVKKAKKEAEDAKKSKAKAEKELKEAYDALEAIKIELNEVNLFNAKLLYTNKIFKAKNLNESQKVKVLAAFDKAASVKEAKLVFETLSAGFTEKKAPMNESLIPGGASKAAGVVAKKPIMEANDQVARWQKLAGIKNNQ